MLTPDSSTFVTFRPPASHEFGPNEEGSKTACIWYLRRPLAWYGPAFLPEFWLTLGFAAALVWSILRKERPVFTESQR